MRTWFFSTLFAAALAVSVSAADAAPPKGWLLAGSDPGSYEVGTDSAIRRSGRASGYLKSKVANASGFGTLMQTFEPGAYAGKRLRLSGWIRADKVTDWAGMWMRIDVGSDTPAAFDNMGGRPIKGTKDWTRYEIVLDVHPKATGIAFGVLLGGTGGVWIDDLQFEIVDLSVPTTDTLPKQPPPSKPQNINFEE